MIRQFLIAVILFSALHAGAQIQVSKIVGKNSSEYKLGYGGFLKFSYPLTEAANLTLEGGANVFLLKTDPAYGLILVPVKLGYRYTLNMTGSGFYVEPQAGYNVYGINEDDEKFNCPIVAVGAGYLFQPLGNIQFDLGLLFESALRSGGAANYVSLRLTHNFSLGRREQY